MNFDKPKNSNYAAVVAKVVKVSPLEGCDNVMGTYLLGGQAIVGKDVKEGDLGIVFPAECQLSREFCRENSLYRHPELNAEPKKGYVEDNRRVKAVKFRGHLSTCLFMPPSCLSYLGVDASSLKEGMTFDSIDGKEVCRKYELVVDSPNDGSGKAKGKAQPPSRIIPECFPLHVDTENYFRNSHLIPQEAEIVVTQKLHGTSVRVAHTVVRRKLTLVERVLKSLGVMISDTEYDVVFGSRKVTKDSKDKPGFYLDDVWVKEGQKIAHLLPKGYAVYGEIIGRTDSGAEIQKGYSYRHETGGRSLYAYRVAIVSPDGHVTDMDFDQMRRFCVTRGIKCVPEVWRGRHSEFVAEQWMDLRLADTGHAQCVPLDPTGVVDEGVVVRHDGDRPVLLKAKSPKFLLHETKMLDSSERDIESSES
jgi:hypothetical protein